MSYSDICKNIQFDNQDIQFWGIYDDSRYQKIKNRK